MAWLGLFLFAFWILERSECEQVLKRFRCLEGFCENITCPILHCSKDKIVANSTYCGCCDSCIPSLEEYESCPEILEGTLGNLPKCKTGLRCINRKCVRDDSRSDSKCFLLRERMEMIRGQDLYANDLWLPECDLQGNFQAVQRKTRKALCVDVQGNRLFGQEEPELFQNMTCGCSHYLNDLQKKNPLIFNTYPQERCSSSGEFERLQCIRDLCYCANAKTGEVETRMVKMAYFHMLPCYDKKIHDRKGILKACEMEVQRSGSLRFHFDLKGHQVYGLENIQCDLDGTFSPTQYFPSESVFVCVDKNGIGIQSYFIEGKSLANLKTQMICNCARDVAKASYHTLSTTMSCKQYGNYNPSQCFDDEQCFCVDTDGNVISKVLNKTQADEDICNLMQLNLLSNLYTQNVNK